MSSGSTSRGRIDQKRLARLARHICGVSLVSLALGCSSDGGGGNNNQPVAGAAGSPASPAGSGGASGGGTSVAGSGPGGAATGGTLSGTGGSLTATGGTSAGAPSGGASAGTGGGGAGGAGAGGTSGGAAGAGEGGQIASGGATAGAGGGGACQHECVEKCSEWGGTQQTGMCQGELVCCEGANPPPPNPLAHLASSAREVGLLLARRFSQQQLAFNSVANLPGDGYKTACEWYGSLGVAKLTGTQDLLTSLVTKFDPLKNNFVNAMTSGEAHVDRYIFGMVPLEIYLQTGDESYLPLGTQVADRQQTTNQTRDAIDDMFMMTGLQLQAYRATKDTKYIDFMSSTMVRYLQAQQSNGLFFHNVSQARVHWGRGNGWFAAGMAEIMRDLPTTSEDYKTIEAGYKKMMDGLRMYQSANGLWYQVLDMPTNPSNWEESSGSAMFTYAMIAGVRRGVLDAATYVPVIEKAWNGLRNKISPQGDVRDICVGTWYKANAQEYMALQRLTGDGHGQAPVLWAAAELLR